jgi:hypothetical protein
MSDRGTPSGRKRPAQKKWPLRRAAKFREEPPRKGGGFAIKDRNTALQQYAGTGLCLQASPYNHSRQNAAEMLEKSVTIACKLIGLLPLSAYVRRSMGRRR